jgi:hypothetical protein
MLTSKGFTYISKFRAIPENLTASSMLGERAANMRYKAVMHNVVIYMNNK